MKIFNINFSFLAIMAMVFFACNDDEQENTRMQAEPEAQMSGSSDSTILHIADISDMNNITYYINQSDLDSFVHLVFDYADVSTSEVIYVPQGDYYALAFNYTFMDNGIVYDASALSPLEDDGIHSFINVEKVRHSFACENTDNCGTCQVDGPTSSTVSAVFDCLCGDEVVNYEFCVPDVITRTLELGGIEWDWYMGRSSF